MGRPDVPPCGLAWAAFLATRGRGEHPRRRGLTGRSALALLGAARVPSRPEILVVAGEPPSVPGVATSCTRALRPDDVWTDARGLAITSWSRSVLALAATASVAELQAVLDASDRRGLLDLVSLDEAMRASGGRSGVRTLRRALEPFVTLPPAEYLSLLERMAHVELVQAGLPPAEVNGRVRLPGGATIRVDLLLRDELLAIELDGRETHERSAQYETDRWRDRQLQLLGLGVLRFTWRDAVSRPGTITRDAHALLARRGVRLGAR